MKSELLKLIIEDIPDRLKGYSGKTYDKSDTAYLLTESENNSGSWYCSSYKAKEAIGKYWDEVTEFVQWYKDNMGDLPSWDVFLDTENFHWMFMIYAYEQVFYQACSNAGLDKDVYEINDEFIAKITEGLKEVEEIW